MNTLMFNKQPPSTCNGFEGELPLPRLSGSARLGVEATQVFFVVRSEGVSTSLQRRAARLRDKMRGMSAGLWRQEIARQV
jgi:hypothetical protein